MILKRLTKTQKDEILEAYRAGEDTNAIAENYNCTVNTINRTVKTLLSDIEYKFLKRKRSKNTNKKVEPIKENVSQIIQKDLKNSESLSSSKRKFKDESQSLKTDNELYNPDFEEIVTLPFQDSNNFVDFAYSKSKNNKNDDKNDLFSDNKFEEIVPLITSFDIEKQKSDFKILNFESLPESAYLIVDKKVELDSQNISDLPEWSFLPKNELKRKAILLFSNQRSAKRSCSRNQRVIKIPKTSIFELSKSYLVSKGITRLILEDSIIALDD